MCKCSFSRDCLNYTPDASQARGRVGRNLTLARADLTLHYTPMPPISSIHLPPTLALPFLVQRCRPLDHPSTHAANSPLHHTHRPLPLHRHSPHLHLLHAHLRHHHHHHTLHLHPHILPHPRTLPPSAAQDPRHTRLPFPFSSSRTNSCFSSSWRASRAWCSLTPQGRLWS